MQAAPLRLSVNGLVFDALAAGPTCGEVVLLLHGFPQFADSWTSVMSVLAQAGYRAVAVDQRGYAPGARPGAVRDYRLDDTVADALGFADGLGAGRFHLVGHDWGGIVAWALGAAHPARLHSLTVLSTPHPEALREAFGRGPGQWLRSSYVALFRLPAPIPERLLLAADARLLRAVFMGRVPAAQVDRNLARLAEGGALTAALNWYRALDRRRRIGPVAVPTLFLWGRSDPALGPAAARATRRHVEAPYRFEPLDAGHWLLEEAPDAVTARLLEHLGRFGPAAGGSPTPERAAAGRSATAAPAPPRAG